MRVLVMFLSLSRRVEGQVLNQDHVHTAGLMLSTIPDHR